MKIAFFDDRYNMVYGAQENLLLLAELAAQHGHTATLIVTNTGQLADAAAERGIDVDVVTAPKRLLLFEREILAGGPRKILETATEIARYGRSLDRRIRAGSYDLVVAGALRPGLLLWRVGLRRRPPILTWAQNSTPRGALAALVGALSWKIGLISAGAETTFGSRTRRALRRKFRPLPSGRDMSRFDARTETLSRVGPIDIVTICSITPRKGIGALMTAMAASELDGARLTVVGGTTGPKSEAHLRELETQASELGVDVRFTGWQDDVTPFLERAHIFALASEDEGLPGVLLEALATGVACVTTRAGGSGELVERCRGGIAVDVGDTSAIAAALQQLGGDHELREGYATDGAANVRAEYGLASFYDGFARILDELAHR